MSRKEASQPDPGFVAHEWGTFTSVQGSDGVQMIWSPYLAPELPSFVYDRNRPGGGKALAGLLLGKGPMVCRQRMETPVIYFYSDRNRTLDVSVRFPNGAVTEWFPFQSAPISIGIASGANPALHWEKIQLLVEPDTKGLSLPKENPGSHYYAARDTDSNMLRIAGAAGAPETEKFLFYRGVGSDTAPLTVKVDAADSRRVTLTNSGSQELRNLFLFEVRENGGGWLKVDRLSPSESREVTLPSGNNTAPLASLGSSLRQALVREGLYEREAAAMVKTWESSWFSERGMRVLYTLPRQWIDEVLPLRIAPTPRETTRVMVARAEIITPKMEQTLRALAERYMAAVPADRPKIVSETRALGLGRFTNSAMQRITSNWKLDPNSAMLPWELVNASRIQPKTEIDSPSVK
jgi:hypothetical protein